MIKYGKAEAGLRGWIKLILRLAGGKRFESISTVECVVKPSKVIIYDSDDGKGDIYVFDRPVSKNYWGMRDQWSEFHTDPKYKRIDDQCIYQERVSITGNLLSLSRHELCGSLSNYLTSQIELGRTHGKKAPASWFLEKPYELLSDAKCLKVFSSSFRGRVDDLIASNKLLTAVPSVIEPWPNISESGGLIFSDLSPVEFRSAPLLHDLCYMLMKYELYGSRANGHKPFLPVIFEQAAKKNSEKNVCGGGVFKFVEEINQLMTFDELMDAYVSMVMLHCYVKYHATGRFIRSSADRRLLTAVRRHAAIFKLIDNQALL